MNANVCPSCGAPQRDGLLCNTEVLKLRQDLRDIPALVEDLAISIARMDKLGTQERGSKGSTHERWAINVDSSAVAWDLENTLTRWAADIARILGYGQPAHRAAIPAASLLDDEMPTVRAHPDVVALTEQIHKTVAHAREHVLGPRERTRIPVGPCPELNHDGSHCEGEVIAYIPRQDAAPSRMQCKLNPDHKWASIQFARVGKRIHHRAEQKRASA